MMSRIQQALLQIQNRIREDEKMYHREPFSVSLLAVSKKQSIEKIREALSAGQKAFAENYLQESLEKMTVLANEDIEWHFIGSIQSNKTAKIAEHFSWVHAVCNFKIAKRLSDQRPSHLPSLNICIEVNSSGENTKSGIDAEHVFELATYCQTLPNVKLRGLMTIPAFKNTVEEQRAELQKLRVVFDDLNAKGFKLDTLSMGMSNDMQAAIAEGATIVRIGTAIFGERES